MNPSSISEIPAALPIGDLGETREEMLRESAGEQRSRELAANEESRDEEVEIVEPERRTSKKKLLAAFAVVVAGFVGLATALAWFFGIGSFAAPVKQSIDRTANKQAAEQASPVSDDEKLKMALNLVAERNPTATPTTAGAVPVASTSPMPPVDLGSTGPLLAGETVAPPESPKEDARNEPLQSNNAGSGGGGSTTSFRPTVATRSSQVSRSRPENPKPEDNGPLGRSLLVVPERMEIATPTPAQIIDKAAENPPVETTPNSSLPFGKLIPVRLLGALYTLRSAGGIVRLELTQEVSGDGFSYPAGTIVAGQLRGSEGDRAFVSIIGLIDARTGGLVKFEGELVGSDGASGIQGRRRGAKSVWSKVLKGLRETGASAIGALGGRSGGTVVIAERSTGELRDELSGIVGTNRPTGEFVEVSAGTSAFVLVTGLPKERNTLAATTVETTGLGDDELADLLTNGSDEKLRAYWPRMTPEFRRLVERSLAAK